MFVLSDYLDYKLAVFILITGFALYVMNCVSTEHFYSHIHQGDEVLRNVYRRMHNLEAVARNEVAQNHGFSPGGGHNINKDNYMLEYIYREGSHLRSQARQDIARRRVPWHARNSSPIGDSFNDCHLGNCQVNMDYNERILGIPSSPGNVHSYHHNK